MPKMEIIIAENLTKKFGNFTAVNGVSFKVFKGEIFGFLGPNGAGKTTSINMLITIMKPTSGEAWINGYSIIREPHMVRRSIGVVFQDNTIDRQLTGRENMFIHGMIYGVPRKMLKEKIANLLKFVELEGFADVQVRNYSGGMIRRLEIARALLHEPQVLFLDEPTLGLDPQTRAKIWDYILELKKRTDMTIFLTTHYMDEAERLCDRVAIIDRGKILAIGTPDELKSMIGNDIVYVRVNVNEKTCRLLASKAVERGLASNFNLIQNNLLSFTVRDAHSFIPRLFDLATELKVPITEVRYSKPTLNDVFLHMTGRELRDEHGDWVEMMRARIRSRFRR